MPYDLMLLADPGPERERVIRVLNEAPDIRPDGHLDNRFWVRTDQGEAQINIGTKDPVESVHVEFEIETPDLAEAVTVRSLALADELDMRIEDVQWGYEIDASSIPSMRAHWQELTSRKLSPAVEFAKKPWWKVW